MAGGSHRASFLHVDFKIVVGRESAVGVPVREIIVVLTRRSHLAGPSFIDFYRTIARSAFHQEVTLAGSGRILIRIIAGVGGSVVIAFVRLAVTLFIMGKGVPASN